MSTYTLRIGDPSEWQGGTLVFSSDWGYTTGTSDDAFLDGPVGSRQWDTIDNMVESSVVTVASLGLTSPGFTNCMLIVANSGPDNRSAGRVYKNGTLPELAVGDSRNYRAYFAALYTGAIGDSYHPADLFETGGSVGAWLQLFMISWGASSSVWSTRLLALKNATTNDQVALTPTLAKGVFWGLEVRIRRTGTTAAEVTHAWIYNAAGTEVYGPANFVVEQVGADSTLDLVSLPTAFANMSFDNFRLGVNGFAADPFSLDNWGAWGGVAIVDNVTQIGPWNGSY